MVIHFVWFPAADVGCCCLAFDVVVEREQWLLPVTEMQSDLVEKIL
jgi:hypothetical protein